MSTRTLPPPELVEVAPGAFAYVPLVNTHHHGDHTFGNWLLPRQTPIIGHVTCREDVLAAGLVASQVLTGPDYGHQEVRPPDVTFTGTMTLHLGDRRVELVHVGPAHTRSDVIVWLPDERTLFAGDIAFAGGQPFLAEGSLAGYPMALARIRDRAYSELEGDPLGTRIRLDRVWPDMVAFHGGPIGCFA
jgi:glyoxylase-like metal-dependent hydrolase (beta-lactamase superfamily II)